MVATEILKFSKRFYDRLDPSLIEGAMDYIKHGEDNLAFEILCDHLFEHEIAISRREYEEAVELIFKLSVDINLPPFKYLRELRANEEDSLPPSVP